MSSNKNKSRSRSRSIRRRRHSGGDSHSDVFSRQVATVRGGRRSCKNKSMRRRSGGGVMFPSSFDNVPIRSFYSQNTFGGDPGYLTVGARNTGSFYGGKSKRYRKTRGGMSFPFIPQIPMSGVYSASAPPKE